MVHRISVKYILLFLLITLRLAVFGAEKLKIGFSQCTTDDLWRETMHREMLIELAFYPDMELEVKDAQDDNTKQIYQIQQFLNQGIDLLIVSPNESEPLTPIVEKVFSLGIPVIVIDRKITSDAYTAFIGADNYTIGWEAGRYAARLLNGKGAIFEISGLPGSSPTLDRHNGFFDALATYPEIRIVGSGAGNWNAAQARIQMANAIETKDFDLVFAHNDVMAKGAYLTAKERNIEKKYYFLGIDGSSGQEGGIQYVIDKILSATFLYPTGGKEALNTAQKILHNLPYEKENLLETVVIDSTNAKVIKIQTEQVVSLQGKIESQKTVLDVQISKYQSQQLLLLIVVTMLFANVILVVLVFRAFRTKIKANVVLENQKQEIENQNVEIISQRDKLIVVSKKLEEATQAKLRFFTNISHEFRTPLTLISGPLEDLINSEEVSSGHKRQFALMHQNTKRLLKLINQLMDFRKLENEKMLLEAGCYDIVAFVKHVQGAFKDLAKYNEINLLCKSDLKECMIWFDWDKLDKVIFNLLSNAFKFTRKGDDIQITLKKFSNVVPLNYEEEVVIKIRDTGKGISQEHLPRLFDRFYQVGKSDSIRGTGLGLPLSKGFVELHHGKIEVESTVGVGTTFVIHLPMGKKHLSPHEILEEQVSQVSFHESPEGETVVDLHERSKENNKNTSWNEGEKAVVLIVEDHQDVREYIRNSLAPMYTIFEAENGKQGLDMVEEENPDIVVSDIMMPEMDGLEMARKLKSDVKTCHIPLILLTARSSEEQRIEGLEEGADSYIPKPFNSRHLRVRVKKLLELRQTLHEKYKGTERFDEDDEQLSRIDKKFLKKLTSHVESNLNREEFSVEELGNLLGLSRVHLYRKIKKLTGMSVSEYIRIIKLRMALPLLKTSGKSVSEIAYEVGFSSPSYFTKCFKEQFGISPSKF